MHSQGWIGKLWTISTMDLDSVLELHWPPPPSLYCSFSTHTAMLSWQKWTELETQFPWCSVKWNVRLLVQKSGTRLCSPCSLSTNYGVFYLLFNVTVSLHRDTPRQTSQEPGHVPNPHPLVQVLWPPKSKGGKERDPPSVPRRDWVVGRAWEEAQPLCTLQQIHTNSTIMLLKQSKQRHQQVTPQTQRNPPACPELCI